jgi:D-sedoheptulose 7-phosphate isomerase
MQTTTLTATTYFQNLSELFLNVQIAAEDGTSYSLDEGCSKAVEVLLNTALGKVLIVGNGGSAAIASHMQNDLCKAVGIPALVFNEAPLLTALSNDLGYEVAFEQQVKMWATPADLLIAISSSGQSANILRAVKMAHEVGCPVITFSGFRADNPLRQMGKLNFFVASETYGYVELIHSILLHFLTDSAAFVPHLRKM